MGVKMSTRRKSTSSNESDEHGAHIVTKALPRNKPILAVRTSPISTADAEFEQPSYVGGPLVVPNVKGMSSSSRFGLVGLRNLGNTCFMASALQCLNHTTQLTSYFLEHDWKKEINTKNPLGMKGQLAKSYGSLVHQLWVSSSQVVGPSDFKSKVSKFAPQFSGYDQHDSHEFLSFLLDGLHEDLNRVISKPYVEDVEADGKRLDEAVSAEAWRNHLSRNKSIIVDLFQGQFKSTLKCLTCGNISSKFDPLMYLSLPLVPDAKGNLTLPSCLNAFTAPEKLTDDERWYCGKCKAFVDATKRISLWKLPPILIVHLKRFKHNRHGSRYKIEDSVEFPITHDLDLSDFVQSPQRDAPVYSLYATSNHHGSLTGGHYTACAYSRKAEAWYEFNDSSFSPISPHDVKSNSAYLLFYHRNITPASPGVRRQTISAPQSWPHIIAPALAKRLSDGERGDGDDEDGDADSGSADVLESGDASAPNEETKNSGIRSEWGRTADKESTAMKASHIIDEEGDDGIVKPDLLITSAVARDSSPKRDVEEGESESKRKGGANKKKTKSVKVGKKVTLVGVEESSSAVGGGISKPPAAINHYEARAKAMTAVLKGGKTDKRVGLRT